MIYLFEAIWHSLSLILYVVWLPAAVILVIALGARFAGWIVKKLKS